MNNLKMESPGRYKISIQGFLNSDWSDRLGGLKIVTTPSPDGRAVTTLSGEVVDQAVLLGVLNALYDLRYPLLSVSCQAHSGPPETTDYNESPQPGE